MTKFRVPSFVRLHAARGVQQDQDRKCSFGLFEPAVKSSVIQWADTVPALLPSLISATSYLDVTKTQVHEVLAHPVDPLAALCSSCLP